VRSILISGASRGLGAALADGFVARGDRVFRGVREPLSDAPDEVALNVRWPDSVSKAVEAVAAASGGIDILINNAGMYLGGPVATLDQDAFKETLDVNLLGAWRLTRTALPHLRKGATIAMISSSSGFIGMANDGAYAASKFALEGMSQSLAAELAPLGIRVLMFEPDRIDTGFTGAQGGDPAAATAADIIALIDRPDAPFRNPVGRVAREISGLLDIDDGRRAAIAAQHVTKMRRARATPERVRA
jgi:NAD(P)-dependent dehydrogenase (short-subunit alcohol dehydrogenase family)